jgi:ABC-type uncharacterized transport system involved in gliding motility auxiliary subunit
VEAIEVLGTANHVYATDGVGPQDFGLLKQDLAMGNFTPAVFTLVSEHRVPDDAAALVIAGPSAPFLQEETSALKTYLDNGGALIILQGPASKADFGDLLHDYQLSFTGNVIIDPSKSVPQDPRVIVVDTYGIHAITRDLHDLTFFPLATDITYSGSRLPGVNITPLAETSNQSWGNTDPEKIQQRPSDPTGPVGARRCGGWAFISHSQRCAW